MREILFRLLKAQKTANAVGGKSELLVSKLLREVRAARGDIEIETWADFESWWNNNRSQSLVYTFIDIYGDDSPEVQAVNELLSMAADYEDKLHALYTSLRNKELGIEPESPPKSESAPAPQPAPPPDDSDAGDDENFSDEDFE